MTNRFYSRRGHLGITVRLAWLSAESTCFWLAFWYIRGVYWKCLLHSAYCAQTSTASESRETESCPEASSHGYWIHQLDTRKTARVNFTYIWPTLLRKLNHKYKSLCANTCIMNISCFSHHINLRMCWWKFTIAITLTLSLTHRIDNVIHHLRNKMRHERFCTIKGIQYYGCAYKSEINHWCSASNFSLLEHIFNTN